MASIDYQEARKEIIRLFQENEGSSRKIIFWYDPPVNFKDDITQDNYDCCKVLVCDKNEFAVKKTLEHDDTDSNYLIYIPHEKPADKENWLLDVLMYSEEYYADTVGSILTVVGWLLCIAFAPVFAGEYQCGAASVVLCTRKGRGRAAVAKCLAVLAVTVLWWALCSGAYVGCQVLLLGTRGLNCPVQAGFFVSSFLPMTVWESELYALVLALVSCLAAVSVTAFFSARMNSTFPAIVCSLGVVLFLPMLSSFLKVEAIQKLLALLPLAKDYSVLFDTQTFHLFGRVLWMPVVLLVVLPLYMVVFLPLAGRIYTRHQVR